MFSGLLLQAFILVALFSGIPLVCGTVVGLVVSIFQAATQIQEQSIGFLAKVACISVSLWLMSSWFVREMQRFFSVVFSAVAGLGAA